MVYATRGLIEALLEIAGERDPEPVTVLLAVTAAADLDAAVSEGASVFTHFYLPEAGRSVRAVFGVDLGTPPGHTPGIFVSHPDGSPAPSETDDFREVVFVAVPPWDVGSVAAYGRDGERRDLELVDAEPPGESPP